MWSQGLGVLIRLTDFVLKQTDTSEQTRREFYKFVGAMLEDQNMSVKISKGIQAQINDLKIYNNSPKDP